jgi:hypothetical protein
MIELKRLVLNFRAEELVVRVLYRTKAGPNPGTVARRWEAADPARSGHLMWGRSPYTLQVALYVAGRLIRTVEVARQDWPQWRVA